MPLTPSRQSQLLTDHIRAMIAAGVFNPGSRLPSMRQFAEQFSLSIGGVQRAIAKLEESGLLESQRGAGIFVCAEHKSTIGGYQKRISVVLERNPSMLETYCAHAMRGIEEKAAEHGCILELDYRGCSISAHELEEKAMISDALILLGTRYDELLEPIHFSCPVIGVEIGNRHGGKASVLSLDPFAAAELAVEFFRRRQCREVIIHTADYPQTYDRAIIFKDRWKKFGVAQINKVQVSTVTIDQHQEKRSLFCFDFNRDLFGDMSCGYLFTSSDFYRRGILQYQTQHGENPNLKTTILSLDGKPFLIPDFEPGHTIMPDWVEVGRSAFNELLRRLQNPGCPSRRIYLDCSLKEYDFSAMKYSC